MSEVSHLKSHTGLKDEAQSQRLTVKKFKRASERACVHEELRCETHSRAPL